MKPKKHCPYYKESKQCVHKGNIDFKTTKKRFCGYSNCLNCYLFMESQSKLKDGLEEPLEVLND